MVPKGWALLTVGDIFDVQLGKMLNKAAKEKQPQLHYLGNSNVRWGEFELSELNSMYFSEREINKYKLEFNDILVCEGGEVGRCAIWERHNSQILYQKALHRLRVKGEVVPRYFQNYMQSIAGTKLLEDYTSRTSIAHLTREKLLSLPIKLPPLPEQQKIANILSTWDKAISTTEHLIHNSTQQKKALMQQLLTGKKRLLDESGKQFEGEWEDSKLGSLYSFKRGKGISKGQLTENGNKCVLYGELYTHYGEVIREVKSRTTETNSVKSIKGDVLIPASTTTTGIDLANATAVLEDDILLGGDINILRPKKAIDAIFMAHLLTHTKKFEIARKGQGITIIHVYGKDLASLDVLVPTNLKEQQKIATVLTTADKEIELLEQQLADLQQEKKALMQQLLTGKKRVVVDG